MLHIITPIYRFNTLEWVYKSIPNFNDVTWHICRSNKREELIQENILSDTRVVVHNVDCEDNEIHKKRNAALSSIKDGFFCFVDDDTLFHLNMYWTYNVSMENGFIGMMVGAQVDSNDTHRLSPSIPIHGKIDTGNVLCHHSCLSSVQWPSKHEKNRNNKDYIFWNLVYNYFNKECGLLDIPISYYNKLR